MSLGEQYTLPLSSPKGSKTQSAQNLNNYLRQLRNGTSYYVSINH